VTTRGCSNRLGRSGPHDLAIAVQCQAIPGGTVCRWHGGAASQVKVKAAIRAEVMNWGLGDSYVDPGEVLLRLVTQSAAPAERYARLRLAPPKLAPAIIGAWLTDSGRESQV
jgi:hypothetical protein